MKYLALLLFIMPSAYANNNLAESGDESHLQAKEYCLSMVQDGTPDDETTVSFPNFLPIRLGCIVSCFKHPQLFVFPLFNLLVDTYVILPQSHKHFHTLDP